MGVSKIARALRAISGSPHPKNFTSAVIAAAGLSTRFGGETTKQRTEICAKPMLYYTLKAYQDASLIHEIIIVARENETAFWEALVAEEGLSKVSRIIVGGATRQESVRLGLDAVSEASKFIAIADGARCLITPDQIDSVCRSAYKYNAATAAHRSTDTVKIADKKGFVDTTADRNTVWLAQTPQVFNTNLYRAAAYTALKKGFEATDDNSLVEEVGHPVRLVECGALNIKITEKEDIEIARAIISKRLAEDKK